MAKREKPGNKRVDYGAEVLKDEYNDVIGRGIENVAAGLGINTGSSVAARPVRSAAQRANMDADYHQTSAKAQGDMGRNWASVVKDAKKFSQDRGMLLDKDIIKKSEGYIRSQLTKEKGHLEMARRYAREGMTKGAQALRMTGLGELANTAIQGANMYIGGQALKSLNESKNIINRTQPRIEAAKALNAASQKARSKKKGSK